MKPKRRKGPTVVMRIPSELQDHVRRLVDGYSAPIELREVSERTASGPRSPAESDTSSLEAMLEAAYIRGVTYGAGLMAGGMLVQARGKGIDIAPGRALLLQQSGASSETAAIWEMGVDDALNADLG